ncbi:MAG: dihydrodipicolinate synthase family protein, partial [Romboutsia sp.]|nr:dihydrodipicolinate synthase family protein [Romboutsia sp.]
GNISQVAEIARLCGENFAIYSGNDDQIVPILSLGGIGVISVLANVLPKETHDIVEKYLSGDVEESRKLQLSLNELVNSLFIEVNPIPVKAAMNLMGMEVGELRLPLTNITEQNLEVLRKNMINAGIKLD